MKRLLLLAATTGYQTRMFAEAARRLGIEPVLATDRCHVMEDPWGDHAIPVRFEDPEAALALLAGPFDGIVAVADRPTLLAAMAAEKLGLPYHSRAAVTACRDKYLARTAFQSVGLRTPEYARTQAIPLWNRFPCVLKPLGLSASRGVIRANDSRELAAAFERISAMLDEQQPYLQIEDFIPGREFALEGIVTAGELQVLALFDKPDPLDGPYFEETLYVTPSREPDEVQRAIVETTEAAIAALGLSHGPVHAEMRVNDRGVWMLEVAARPIGGLCAKALRFDGGMGLEELIVLHAMGEDVSRYSLMDAASGVMMIPIPKSGVYQSVSGLEQAKEIPGIVDVIITAKEGQRMVPLPEGASYLGFIFARGETPGQVEEALRRAHGDLRFEIATALEVMKVTPSAVGRLKSTLLLGEEPVKLP